MGFFDRLYYGKAGQKDYTEMDMPSNRISLFFRVWKDHWLDIVKVNLMQVVFWIPFLIWTYLNLSVVWDAVESETLDGLLTMWLIGNLIAVTITGPSSAASAYIMRNWARDEHSFLFSDFKDAFVSNWKQALGVSALTALIPFVAKICIQFYGAGARQSLLYLAPLMLIGCVLMIWELTQPLLFPLVAGYKLSFKNVIKDGVLLAAAGVLKVFAIRLLTAVPIVLLIIGVLTGNAALMMGVSCYYLLYGFAFSRLLEASVANALFDQYLNPKIEGAPVGLGLRPREDPDEEDDEEEDE